MTSPLLSVCVITYNHELYLRQAIDGILAQKVDFPWEIIIADDYSTDKTRDIILEYSEKYPDLIRPILRDHNVGPSRNFLELLASAKGKFIAYIEGDDYWSDPLKLKKQLSFLDKNEAYVCCAHNSEVIDRNGFVRLYNDNKSDRTLSRKDLITTLEIHTSSILFRNCLGHLPQYLLDFPLDIIFYFFLSDHGKFLISAEIMAIYRQHEQSIWTGQGELEKINKRIAIQDYLMHKLPVSADESKAIKQTRIDLRLNRLKIYANRSMFNLVYFKDAANLLLAKLAGYRVKTKFLFFCMAPDHFISRVNKLRSR